MKTVLVTGAAGFIGSHLCESLLHQGITVVGLDNFDPFYNTDIKDVNLKQIQNHKNSEAFHFFKGDINNKNDLEILEQFNFDMIFHLAAKAGVRPSIENPTSYVEANIKGTVSLLEWASKNNINKIVFGSSSSVYGNSTQSPFSEDAVALKPYSPYAATKRSCELFLETAAQIENMQIVSLRFFTVYGPRQRPDLAIHMFMQKMLLQQKIKLFGDGSTARDYTYIDDIVDGIHKAAHWLERQTEPCHEIFNLGGNKTVSLLELVKSIEVATNQKAIIEWHPMQKGDVLQTCANLSKSQKILGYNPNTDIQKGLKQMADWLKAKS
jgi:UDP-glucuronate 4-epimerase